MSIMYLVFTDESGVVYSTYKKCQNRRQSALLVVGAVGIQENQLGLVNSWFADMKCSFFGNKHPRAPQALEIKGSILNSLRRGVTPNEWSSKSRRRAYTKDQKQVWSSLPPTQLRALEESVFDLMQRIKPTIWAVVVKQDKVYQRFKSKTWHPFYWALTYLQQRVLWHVQTNLGTYERGLLVLDENSNLRQGSQFDEFLRVRETINNTASWPAPFGMYLVDVPMFGQSHLHEALQLADIAAHSVWQHVNKTDSLGWFGRIEPLLAHHWRTGKVDHAGLTFIE